jgi:uncharacterized membrane protein
MSTPEKYRAEVKVKGTAYQGPIPPPADLERYNAILPGAAERILAMAERQANHRQSLEKKVLDSDAFHALLGIICALIIALVGLGVAGYIIINGHDWAGAIIGGATLASMVSAFIYGSSKLRRERKEQTLPARQ